MATSDQVKLVRRLSNYTETDPYDDPALSEMIDTAGSVDAVVSQLWNEKAAALALLVNTSESGSSRSLGDAHKNALTMAKYYKGLADEAAAETPVDTTRYARTRPAVREG